VEPDGRRPRRPVHSNEENPALYSTRSFHAYLRTLVVAIAFGGFSALAQAQAQATASKAIDDTLNANRASRASQQRIDQIDSQTRALLEKYLAATWQAQQLTAYSQQLEEQTASLDAQHLGLQRQIGELERTERELAPLLSRMIQGLDKFVALDMPFLLVERRERVQALKKLMADPAEDRAEKFKKVLEAWQIEAEYGRSLGVENGEVERRKVHVLRVGRAALYYLSIDGKSCGVWNAKSKSWTVLPARYASQIRLGLRMARETAAPDLLRLPMLVSGAGP